jgi:hypothetical protein
MEIQKQSLMHSMPHSCPLLQIVICLLDKDAITWKESLVDKRFDLLLQHLGEKATSNQETKLGVFGYGAMQFG